MTFPYKVVAITGASSGLGREMALQLAAQGCKLGLMARRKEQLDDLATEVAARGGEALALPCDVGDYAQVEQAVARIEQSLGPIECMIANAGIGQVVEQLAFDRESTDKIFRTNVLGMTNAFYASVPAMLQRKAGHLVGVASLASYQGLPVDAGYAASKAAMRIHCESMRIELRGTGVAVTTICPGFVRTPMTDLNDFNMPFLLEAPAAARRMLRAIARKRRVYNFPKPLWWLIKLGNVTPRFIYDAFLAWQLKSTAGKRTQPLSTQEIK